MTVVQLMYSMAFQGKNDLGIAGALSVIVLVALVLINVFQLRLLRGGEEK
jgi:multiple sugar transport system permease protein